LREYPETPRRRFCPREPGTLHSQANFTTEAVAASRVCPREGAACRSQQDVRKIFENSDLCGAHARVGVLAAHGVGANPVAVFNIRYYDYAFASSGEGLGANFLIGDNYRAGVALAYDLGRHEADDYTHLRGMGNIDPAPVVKLFASYVVSKKFPLVLRADVRQLVGGGDGALGDLSAYLPLPGSSKKLAMFAGPSITFADHLYLQKEFGVSTPQALASGNPQYESHPGVEAVGLGFSATRFISSHWLINLDAAVNHLHGSAAQSPLTQRTGQRVLAVSIAYSR
jgi:outer membrane scaffolding protein for murein synthesis (MipA/OmpV family)